MDLVDYFQRLDANTEAVLMFARQCSKEQLAARKPEGWTVLQVLEHICLTDQLITAIVKRPSEKIHSSPENVGAGKIHHLTVVRRDRKVTAPERLLPNAMIADAAMFESTFLSQRDILKDALRSGAIAIDQRMHRHPYFGEMTIADWLNFVIGHTQRHLDQMLEIVALQE